MSNPSDTRISIVSKNFRNHRLYLEPVGENVIDIEIARLDGQPLNLEPDRTRLAIDFGRLEFGAREDEELGVRLADWSVAREPQRIVLTRRTAAAIGKGDRITLRLPLPPLVERFRKPYGTVLLSLDRNGQVEATAEFEQSVVSEYSEPPATPPVLVAWCGQISPVLTLNRTQSLDLMIVNARLNRRGDPKMLVSVERGGLSARIRLSFPALPQSDGTLATLTDRQGLDRIVPETGAENRKWAADDRPESWEITTDAANATVFEEGKGLRVALREVTPTRVGSFVLCVTLLDLPGYARATYSLPFTVVDPDDPAIADLRVDPPGATAPRTVMVGWKVAGGTPCDLTLTAHGAGAPQTLRSGAATPTGCVAFALAATTRFELTVSRNGRSVSRSVTAFIAQPRSRSGAIRITPPVALNLPTDANKATTNPLTLRAYFEMTEKLVVSCDVQPDETSIVIVKYKKNRGFSSFNLESGKYPSGISISKIIPEMDNYVNDQKNEWEQLMREYLSFRRFSMYFNDFYGRIGVKNEQSHSEIFDLQVYDLHQRTFFRRNVEYIWKSNDLRDSYLIKSWKLKNGDYNNREWKSKTDMQKRIWWVKNIFNPMMASKVVELSSSLNDASNHIANHFRENVESISVEYDWIGTNYRQVLAGRGS